MNHKLKFITFILLSALVAYASADNPNNISSSDNESVSKLLGNKSNDPAFFHRTAQTLGGNKLTDIIYRAKIVDRLAAINSLAFLSNPWPVIPTLASLMRAHHRSTASAAANSLLFALKKQSARLSENLEVTGGFIVQLTDNLKTTLFDDRLDSDIRVCAMLALFEIQNMNYKVELDFVKLAKEKDLNLKNMSYTLVKVPFGKKTYHKIISTLKDAAGSQKAAAVTILCENEQAGGALEPSDTLKGIFKSVLENKETKAMDIISLIPCIAGFHERVRFKYFDIISQHPSPLVAKYLKNYKNR